MPLEPIVLDATGSVDDLVAAVNTFIDFTYLSEPPPEFVLDPLFAGVTAWRSHGDVDSSITINDLVDITGYTPIYVNNVTGDDNNTGADPAAKKKSIDHAVNRAIALGVDSVIYVDAGIYERINSAQSGLSRQVLTANIAIVAVGGRVVSGAFDNLTWSKTAGQDNVYEAARSNAAIAVDPSEKDSDGFHLETVKASSIADCNSKPGSWFTDNVTVYVHQKNSQPVTNDNARIYLNSSGYNGLGLDVGNNSVYLEGIDFEGGAIASVHLNCGASAVCVMNRCTLRYSIAGTFSSLTASECLKYTGGGVFYASDCDFSRNSKDGANFHANSGLTNKALLLRCTGIRNGSLQVPGTTSCNGATAHGGCSLIVLGGEYSGSLGTPIAHVDDGTNVWCAFVKAGESVGDIPNGGSVDWGGFGIWNGNGEMWLDSCEDVGSRIGLYAAGGATIHIRNHKGMGSRVAETGGVIQAY